MTIEMMGGIMTGYHGDRWHHQVNACAQTSLAALAACKLAAQEEYKLALGSCYNVGRQRPKGMFKEAKSDFKDAMGNVQISGRRARRFAGNWERDPMIRT